MRLRIDVMHGVNFDVLGSRNAEHYGGISLTELEVKIKQFARELEMEPSFSQTNHEGDFVERLHRAGESADGLILNPGAWTHYSWAIRDALEVAGLPAVEVHLSVVDERECVDDWSVVKELQAGNYSLESFDFKVPAKELRTGAAIIRDHAGSGFEMFDYPNDYVEPADGEKYAMMREQDLSVFLLTSAERAADGIEPE